MIQYNNLYVENEVSLFLQLFSSVIESNKKPDLLFFIQYEIIINSLKYI